MSKATYILNPFRPTRWEHQSDGFQLIWFTDTAKQLTEEKSVYVRGSRGSGKTTLLRSICWEDLTENVSLKMQTTLGAFKHIGVYIRFPDHLSATMPLSAWVEAFPSSAEPEIEYHSFFSLIVELTCIERVLEACHSLRVGDHLTMNAGREVQLVDEVVKEFAVKGGGEVPRTFRELARTLRNIVRTMNEACSRGELEDVVYDLPRRQPGEMLAFVSERLTSSIQMRTKAGMVNPSFKFCLDDCEVLNASQQKSLNTLVRKSRSPVSWVVSSVGAFFDSTATLINEQPLTDADRRVISLDKRSDEDFRHLCQAVVSLRLLFSVSEESRIAHQPAEIGDFFPLNGKLGGKDVNDFIATMVKKSASPLARELRRAATILRDATNVGARKGKKHAASSLPYYEAYVLLHWRRDQDSFRTSFDAEDVSALPHLVGEFKEPRFEAWLRRKQRGAMLQIAAKLGVRRLPLSGANVVVSLADGSIRDFLEILGEIYAVYAKKQSGSETGIPNLDRFATSRTPIAADTQVDGIHAASAAYLSGISARADRDSDALVRLVEGLGRYTAILQSDPDDPSVLGRAERGVFSVKFARPDSAYLGDAMPSQERAVWNIIRQAEIAGYVRTIQQRLVHDNPDDANDQRGRIVTFRLHRRFAPLYRFSFRGAYETTSLRTSDLWQLCDRGRPVEPVLWADMMAKRSSGVDESQLLLPLHREQ